MVVDRLQALVGEDVITLASVPLDMSLNPVLDPGESQCYPYSISSSRSRARRTGTTRASRSRTIRATPARRWGRTRRSTSRCLEPTVVNGSVNVDDTNGLSWLFTDSGTQTYTRTFRATRTKARTSTPPRSARPARATTRA